MIRHFRISGTTDPQTGKLTLSQQIPGTFTSLISGTPGWSGRVIWKAECRFANGVLGDYFTNIALVDTNGKLSSISANFPNYPVIQSRNDAGLSQGNQGLYIFPDGQNFQIMPVGGTIYVPSELFLQADFYAVGGGTPRQDTLYLNIYWDDLQ